jgi:hypothetical protein
MEAFSSQRQPGLFMHLFPFVVKSLYLQAVMLLAARYPDRKTRRRYESSDCTIICWGSDFTSRNLRGHGIGIIYAASTFSWEGLGYCGWIGLDSTALRVHQSQNRELNNLIPFDSVLNF